MWLIIVFTTHSRDCLLQGITLAVGGIMVTDRSGLESHPKCNRGGLSHVAHHCVYHPQQRLSAPRHNSRSGLVKIPFCFEWIEQSIDLWDDAPPHPSIYSFALRLTGLMGSDRKKFRLLQNSGIVNRFRKQLERVIKENASVALAYVDMLSGLLKHEEGCYWVVQSELWKDVIAFCVENKSIYLTRGSQTFVTDLVTKLQADEDWGACEKILSHIFGPLVNTFQVIPSVCIPGPIDLGEDDKNFVIASLTLSCSIFEASLSGTCTMISQMLEKYDLETIMWQLLESTDDEECNGRISRILVLIYFVSLGKECDVSTNAANQSFKTKIFDILSHLVAKKSLVNILNLCSQCQIYLHKFDICGSKFEGSSTILKSNSKLFDFEDQINCMHVMPILACLVTTKASDDNFCVDTYCEKIHNITCEETLRIMYSFRDFLVDKGSHRQNSLQAVISIMQIKDYLSRDRGVIVFQAFTYSLKDFITGWPNAPVIKNECVLQYPELLSALLDGLTTLIEQFQITWRDSVESICLFTFTEQLLNNPCLSAKLAVKTLKLMQRTIQSYMPPNLALLVNTMGGSSINQLGPLIHKRMHDVSWEVRDSALELLHTIATISYVKFTAFQGHVLENELCSLALSLVLDDSESYVRVSALKCLAAMVMVSRYWTDCLCSKNLPVIDKSLLVENMHEKTVTAQRHIHDEIQEAGGVKNIHISKKMLDYVRGARKRYHEYLEMKRKLGFKDVKHPSLTIIVECLFGRKSVEDEIYQAMTIAATSDLYWEVKVNVLSFWEKVIEQQMSDQGMIDGVFPNVTFSKENRKIVTLTSEAIKLRLNKALEELARLGCLQALLSGIYDCDLQVVHKAVAITQSLLDLLYKNGVSTTNTAAVNPDKKLKITNGCKDICSPSEKTFDRSISESQVSLFNQEFADNLFSSGSPPDSMSETPPHSLEQVDDSSTSDSPARVIETIVFDSDINLLSKVYHRSMSVSNQAPNPSHRSITAKEFLLILGNINLSNLVAERNRWLDYYSDNLDSLLDDLISSHREPGQNIIDCY
uniref:BRCA1-associated ATM activator 1 n=1 Tax=Timema shepardi TaxID=629360 RepID=A0A7R9AM12_TIMSH|nr:unnamed protein product [Timema shepardi]